METKEKSRRTNRGGVYPVMGKDGKQARDKHGRQRWLVQVYDRERFDPKKGKMSRKLITQRFAGSREEAKALKLSLDREIAGGLNMTERHTTLDDFIPTWEKMLRLEGDASETTIAQNVQRLSHVRKYIGGAELKDIDARLVTEVMSLIQDDKTLAGGKGLSGTSMNMIFRTLKRCLEDACAAELIMRNPMNRLKAPKKSSVDRKSLDADGCRMLLRALDEREEAVLRSFRAKEHRMHKRGWDEARKSVEGISQLTSIMAVRIALNTGARRGEVLGLSWDCVDLGARPSIAINKTLTSRKVLKEPKTEASIGILSIDQGTAEHLRRLRAIEAEYIPSVTGVELAEDAPVCCDDRGGWYDPTNFSRWWRDFREYAGLPDLLLHELRHTNATLLGSSGLPIKEVQARLRHAKASTTQDYYMHATEEGDR
ncbi:MAG: site-specific integrase, partial [Coriobacteriales bacterium]|nr:site-specific integrase [Coriobacteriales bacterium]